MQNTTKAPGASRTSTKPSIALRAFTWVSVLWIVCLGSYICYKLLWTAPLPSVIGSVIKSEKADFGRIELPNGCVVVNNTWNRQAARAGFEEEVFLAQRPSGETPGWRWRSPWQFPPKVISQPQIVCGDKPWDEPRKRIAGFPFAAGSKRLSVDFATRLAATGTYNMSFSLWAVSSLPSSRANITHEIMIWTIASGQRPAGERLGTMNAGGNTFDVFVEHVHGDASGQNRNTWMYVAFVPHKNFVSGRLELTAFTNYLLSQKLLTRDQYLTSVEFGNEVSDGAGIVELEKFSFDLQ